MIRAVLLTAGLALQAVSPEIAQHVRAGVEAQKQGHMAEAIAEFRKVTELDPSLPAAFVNLGAAYMQNHQYAAAIVPLRKSLELDPSLAGAQQMLGYALLATGYAGEAIPYLEKTHSQDALGIAQVKVGRFPEAVANLSEALKNRPNDPELLYYLGRASGLLSKESFDVLESSYPQSARAHQALAENYAALREIPEAEKEYLEAIRLRPDAPGIHLALGRLYEAASQWSKAEEQFQEEAKLQPGDAEAAYRLGNARLQQGNVAGAKPELARSDQLRPQMPETLYALGKAESMAGDLANAEQTWHTLLKIEGSGALSAQAHFGLASIYRKQGKAAEAERETQEYRRLTAH